MSRQSSLARARVNWSHITLSASLRNWTPCGFRDALNRAPEAP